MDEKKPQYKPETKEVIGEFSKKSLSYPEPQVQATPIGAQPIRKIVKEE
ncbi:MAG: hypothetical protein NTY20_06090 [Candidatus Aenigmarchaeota archaeon]|nr:hypothetical protein [Candidatus Aenigmarchaeota archaeon]